MIELNFGVAFVGECGQHVSEPDTAWNQWMHEVGKTVWSNKLHIMCSVISCCDPRIAIVSAKSILAARQI